MKKITKIGIGGLTVVAIAGSLALLPLAAQAAPPTPVGSDEGLYVWDGDTITTTNPTTPIAFNKEVVGSTTASGATGTFTLPSGGLTYYAFVSPIGSETTRNAWNVYGGLGSNPASAGNITPLTLSGLTGTTANSPGTASALASAGGMYSLGLAAVNLSNVVVYASYTSIQITSGTLSTANWVWANPPIPSAGENDYTVTVPVIASVDTGLGIEAPAALNVTLGTGTLSDGTTPAGTALTEGAFGLSKTTGQLGAFVVTDGRYSTHPGWHLDVDSTTFVYGATTIAKAQLGIKPVVLPAGTTVGSYTTDTVAGVTAAPEQVAGSATYPALFAETDGSWDVGRSAYNADLTFLAPAGTPPGNYVGTVTISITSN